MGLKMPICMGLSTFILRINMNQFSKMLMGDLNTRVYFKIVVGHMEKGTVKIYAQKSMQVPGELRLASDKGVFQSRL